MKLSSLIILAAGFVSAAAALPVKLQKRNSRWDYESNALYGVNIGGWLVLEPYITPSLFEAFGGDDSTKPIDEYHFCQAYGADQASEALGWCEKYNLKAWIDLHGVPGSQNGFDNSGLRDEIDWQTTEGYVQVTTSVLSQIAQKYSGDDYSDVVIGIELVNEPLGPALDADQLVDYYNDGYEIVRNEGDVPVIIHDAFFQFNHYWDNVLNTQIDPSVWDVILDHHHYQIFSVGELQRSTDDHVSFACNIGWQESGEYHSTLCGEWTAALTDCAKWLNGMARGARYDATYQNDQAIGSCDNLFVANYDYFTDEEVRSTYRRYVEAQMDAYTFGKMNGWVFWCWKTENLIEWDFKQLVSLNIIPQPLTAREYWNQCGYIQY
ncbi:hypothetical protein PMKS-002155 [Pichia membranifaciens]|uniref:glucan 1,3-beta-glucosidase n=1 Tax=Pichia membranifaciens TaxID=4926 RepID=A0A1Q2YGS2_9ASCO|nr:hypothetical protein PMKS-002155 [Pichia membranifaciens]